MSDLSKVAAVQFAPEHSNPEHNRQHTIELVSAAHAQGAGLVVLPECCITGYVFHDRNELLPLAEPMDGPSVRAWQRISAATGVWVVAGLAERVDDTLFNSAVLVGPDGQIAVYRKIHLWGLEKALYQPGEHLVVYDTGSKFGKIGLAICYDLWFPELARGLALSGATLIAAPANWSKNSKLPNAEDRLGVPLGYQMSAVTACVNELAVVSTDRVGQEQGIQFLGKSCIFGPNGRELCLPGSTQEPEIVLADMPDVSAFRQYGHSHLAARRPGLYAEAAVPTCL
jgi:predicted amidohydrolase